MWKKNSKMELVLSREQSKVDPGGFQETELTNSLNMKLNFWTELNQQVLDWHCIAEFSITK